MRFSLSLNRAWEELSRCVAPTGQLPTNPWVSLRDIVSRLNPDLDPALVESFISNLGSMYKPGRRYLGIAGVSCETSDTSEYRHEIIMENRNYTFPGPEISYVTPAFNFHLELERSASNPEMVRISSICDNGFHGTTNKRVFGLDEADLQFYLDALVQAIPALQREAAAYCQNSKAMHVTDLPKFGAPDRPLVTLRHENTSSPEIQHVPLLSGATESPKRLLGL